MGRKRPLQIQPKADVGSRFREAGILNVCNESGAAPPRPKVLRTNLANRRG